MAIPVVPLAAGDRCTTGRGPPDHAEHRRVGRCHPDRRVGSDPVERAGQHPRCPPNPAGYCPRRHPPQSRFAFSGAGNGPNTTNPGSARSSPSAWPSPRRARAISNVIAPILTMFFLATYAVVNIVSAVERLLRSPSFRPTFKVHWGFSLLGAIGCVGGHVPDRCPGHRCLRRRSSSASTCG